MCKKYYVFSSQRDEYAPYAPCMSTPLVSMYVVVNVCNVFSYSRQNARKRTHQRCAKCLLYVKLITYWVMRRTLLRMCHAGTPTPLCS